MIFRYLNLTRGVQMNEKAEMIGRIQSLINQHSKNKSQILRELHLSTSTLSDWEKGKGNPSSTAIIKLSEYFDVTTDYILFGRGKEDNKELSSSENEWIKLYYALSDSQKQELSGFILSFFNKKNTINCLSYLSQLSEQELEICTAFIQGILAEKRLNENT